MPAVITNDIYSVASGQTIYGGRSQSPLVSAGAWQALSVAAHSRKIIGESVAISGTFDPTIAQTIDARSPSTVSAIPYKSFGNLIVGEPGYFYYHGSLHSNYPGNEIDRIDAKTLTGTQLVTTLSHQPRVPPNGPDSGYGSGSSGYVFRQYDTPLADGSDWQPYAHHTWTQNTWHPTWGYVAQVTGALGDGATVGANPAGSGTKYQQATSDKALVSYDYAEGKYHTRVLPALNSFYQTTSPGRSGASDWNQHRASLIFLENNGSGTTAVREVVNTNNYSTELFTFNNATLGGNEYGWANGTSGNGVLLRHMEGHKYLGMRADFSKSPSDPVALNSYTTLFMMALSNTETPTHNVYKLTPPASALTGINPHGDGNISFCIDKNSRRIFWLVYENNPVVGEPQFMRIYVAGFDTPMDWTEVVTTGFPEVIHTDYQAGWLASCRQPIVFYNGYLFMIPPGQGTDTNPGYTNGAVKFWRVKVDSGESLPALEFSRYDYWAQAPGTNGFRFSDTTAVLQMIGTKHVNWAYRPSDAKYYQFAGDFGMSTCQSMCTLAFDGTERGYTFTETLDEVTLAPVGKVRPVAPDDGYWFYVPTDSAWVAGRGKFVFKRGGDGEPMFYNAALRAAYGASDVIGTITQVQAAIADRWSLPDKLYLFDPDTTTFTTLGPTYSLDTSGCTPPSAAGATFPVASMNGWTQDNGSTYWPDVFTASSSSSRNGAFDPVTGTLWSFYVNGALAKFDMSAKTVQVFNCSSWVSDETGRTIFLNGASPGSFPVIADGTKEKFCYQDTGDSNRYKTYGAFEWEHKATWIDPATGYLYVVSPATGYLWRFDTRGTVTNTDGYRIPFGPVGKRIPFSGTYPATNSLTAWPPVIYDSVGSPNNSRVQMNGILLPYKGGLLHWTPNLHDSGTSGEPRYAFWRRIGYTGEWSVVTMPQEFAANAAAAASPYDLNNAEVFAISQAWTDNPDRQYFRYFWRLHDGA